MNRWSPMHTIRLHTMSHPTYDHLLGAASSDGVCAARMLARFVRALNLIVGDTVIALVTPEVGNGPFHLVVDPLPPPLIGDSHPIWWEAGALRIGSWALHYGHAVELWEPQPDWDQTWIGDRQRQRLHHAIECAATAKATDPAAAAAPELGHRLRGVVEPLAEAVASLDLTSVRAAAAGLSGLGVGLTPTGDDFLAGAMLALWAGHHPHREPLCSAIAEAAKGRTTTLSEAFLGAAARGEATEPWHRLLSALSAQPREGKPGRTSETNRQVQRAVSDISTYGATSGFDMLAGFEAGLSWCAAKPQ